jgi:hypothetical protein
MNLTQILCAWWASVQRWCCRHRQPALLRELCVDPQSDHPPLLYAACPQCGRFLHQIRSPSTELQEDESL